jgi:hypothetical protein
MARWDENGNEEDSDDLCACGLPLHYPERQIELLVHAEIARLGPVARIVTPDGAYAVPRHYLALHGPTPEEVAAVAVLYGFARLDGSSHLTPSW